MILWLKDQLEILIHGTNTRPTATSTAEVVSRNTVNESHLLKDLIKIIIIKQLLSRTNNSRNFNAMGNMNFPNNNNNYYNPYFGMI